MTVPELRALVGDAGALLTDEELLRRDVATDRVLEVLVGAYRDRLDPAGAARRQQQLRMQMEREKAPRRRRYERERARAQARAAARRTA